MLYCAISQSYPRIILCRYAYQCFPLFRSFMFLCRWILACEDLIVVQMILVQQKHMWNVSGRRDNLGGWYLIVHYSNGQFCLSPSNPIPLVSGPIYSQSTKFSLNQLYHHAISIINELNKFLSQMQGRMLVIPAVERQTGESLGGRGQPRLHKWV